VATRSQRSRGRPRAIAQAISAISSRASAVSPKRTPFLRNELRQRRLAPHPVANANGGAKSGPPRRHHVGRAERGRPATSTYGAAKAPSTCTSRASHAALSGRRVGHDAESSVRSTAHDRRPQETRALRQTSGRRAAASAHAIGRGRREVYVRRSGRRSCPIVPIRPSASSSASRSSRPLKRELAAETQQNAEIGGRSA